MKQTYESFMKESFEKEQIPGSKEFTTWIKN